MPSPMPAPQFETRLAADAAEIAQAQRLRYDVFVRELGGNGDMVDHAAGLERDRFDPYCEHLLLLDRARPAEDQVVGVYRLMTEEGAARAGQYYTESEYDLTALKTCGRRLLELGRSCLHADYRGGAGMFNLWQALGLFVGTRGIEVLFGTASFHGTDTGALALPLSHLHHNHLAPAALRVSARPPHAVAMDILPADQIDRRRAMLKVPSLIKAYLRLGGAVGEGAWVDHDFNTIDVCLVMDTARMSEKQKAIYAKGKGA